MGASYLSGKNNARVVCEKSKAEFIALSLTEAKNATSKLKNIQKKTRSMSDIDVINDLKRLGIMRTEP